MPLSSFSPLIIYFLRPVDGEEQVVDTDHDLVPEWAGVAVALSPQLTVAVDHELSQVQNQSAKFKSICFFFLLILECQQVW